MLFETYCDSGLSYGKVIDLAAQKYKAIEAGKCT